MAYYELASAALDTSNGGWSDHNVRQAIASAGLSKSGLLTLRFTFNAGTGEGLNIASAYVGLVADSGDAYDFAGTPTQILSGGSGNFTVPAGGSVVSDPVSFTLTAGKNLLISIGMNSADTANDTLKYKATVTNWAGYYKSASSSSAATVNVTGYLTGHNAYIISKIEYLLSDGVTYVDVSNFGVM